MVRPYMVLQVARKTNHPFRDANPSSSSSSSSSNSSAQEEVIARPGPIRRKGRKGNNPHRADDPSRQNYNTLKNVKKIDDPNKLCIPKAAFCRIVKDALEKESELRGIENIKIQASAIHALHVTAETYLVNMFCDLQLLVLHAKRVTLMEHDFRLLKILRRNMGDKVMLSLPNP